MAEVTAPQKIYPGPGSGDTFQAGQDGLLLVIGDYVNEWMPNYKKALESDSLFRKAMTFPETLWMGNITRPLKKSVPLELVKPNF